MPTGLQNHSPARRSEIARLGGRAVKESSRTFFRDPQLAQEIGRRGGLARARKAAERKALEALQ